MLEELLLFDSSRPSPSGYNIMIYTLGILIVSNVIFVLLCSALGLDGNISVDDEKKKEFETWKAKNVSPWMVLVSEILNSTIYSPVAEELTFRVVLLKYILVKQSNIDPQIANVLQALIFGLIHVTNTVFSTQSSKYTTLQTISATITGFISGWVYIHSNSVLPALFSHMINNGSAGLGEVISYVKFRRQGS